MNLTHCLSKVSAELEDPGGSLFGVREDALNDLIVGIFDECSAATLKKEKTIGDFISSCLLLRILFIRKYKLITLFTDGDIVKQLKESRLTKDHFQTIKVIGRGAFGEVILAR